MAMTAFLSTWAQTVQQRTSEPMPELWPLNRPATVQQVDALEERLGVTLPPSYREFLLFSNGTSELDPDEYLPIPHLSPCDRVGWLPDVDPFLLELIAELREDDEQDDEHESHEPAASTAWGEPDSMPCDTCLPKTLVIGQGPDSRLVLLDPTMVDEAGEWECWEYDIANVHFVRVANLRAYFQLVGQDYLPRTDGIDPFAASLAVAQDNSLAYYERQPALSALAAAGGQQEALEILLDMIEQANEPFLLPMQIGEVGWLLHGGAWSPRVEQVLIPLATPDARPDEPGIFEEAVSALSKSDHPSVVAAVRRALREHDAHNDSLRDSLYHQELYTEEIWALWEWTHDPGWLLCLGDDPRALPALKAWWDHPTERTPPMGGPDPYEDRLTRDRVRYWLEPDVLLPPEPDDHG